MEAIIPFPCIPVLIFVVADLAVTDTREPCHRTSLCALAIFSLLEAKEFMDDWAEWIEYVLVFGFWGLVIAALLKYVLT